MNNHSSFKKTIGIIGGMGPAASVHIYNQIICLAQKEYHAREDCEYPSMIIYNLPIIGFDEKGSVKSKQVKDQMINAVKKLEQAGCSYIIIACNTMYYLYTDLQNVIKIPLINLIKQIVNVVEKGKYKSVGILSSQNTKELSLYEKGFAERGVKSILTTNNQQKLVNNVILNVMAGNQCYKDKMLLKSIIEDFIAKGAQAIIIGCTELPLAICQQDVKIKIFNTSEIIAKLVLDYAQK